MKSKYQVFSGIDSDLGIRFLPDYICAVKNISKLFVPLRSAARASNSLKMPYTLKQRLFICRIAGNK